MESTKKIYLALPDPDLNRSVRAWLEDGAFRLQEAMDWSLVPEEVGLFGADVVVLENELPGLGAELVVAQLKADPRTADRPIIVILPAHDDEAATSLAEAGADAVLAQPLDTATLVGAVSDALAADLLPEAIDLEEVGFELEEMSLDGDATMGGDEPDSVLRIKKISKGLPTGSDNYYDRDLGVVIEISEAMASSLGTSDALYILTRRLAATIPVHRCNVVLMGVKIDEAFVLASHDDANIRKREIDLGKYPEVRRCVESGEELLIEDVRKDPEMEQVLDFISSIDLRSALVVPLYVREAVVGTLSLTTRRESSGFSRREILLTRVMANLASGLLATSDLLDEVRKAAASEKPPMEEFDEVVLDLEDQIEGLIEELERK